MTDRIRIREARDDDAEGLIALIARCFADYEGVLLDVDGEMPELRRIASAYEADGGEFWIAELDDEVVGSIGWVPTDDGGIELRKLYVHPRVRRRGLASRLCDRVEAAANDRGGGYVDLWSDVKFTSAHRLYERRGYVRGPVTRLLHDISDTVEFYFRLDLDGIA